MAASTMGTALAVLVALLATAATAQQIPSSSDCLARTQSIGENNLLLRYARDKHSSLKRGDVGNANGLLAGSGELAYCLCNKDVLDTTLSTIQNNPLARSAGVTGAAIQQVLSQCGVPIAGSNACKAGGGVSVQAPGTQVQVARGGATSVSAPGTQVNVGGGAGGGGGGAAAAAPAAGQGGFFAKKHPFLDQDQQQYEGIGAIQSWPATSGIRHSPHALGGPMQAAPGVPPGGFFTQWRALPEAVTVVSDLAASDGSTLATIAGFVAAGAAAFYAVGQKSQAEALSKELEALKAASGGAAAQGAADGAGADDATLAALQQQLAQAQAAAKDESAKRAAAVKEKESSLAAKQSEQSKLQNELSAAQRALTDASAAQRTAEAAAEAAAARAAAAEERLSAASQAAAAAAAELGGLKAAAAKKLSDLEAQLAEASAAVKKATEEKEAAEAGAARARSEMGSERAKASRLQVTGRAASPTT
ncbi:hypothetical protein MNEG_1176 [Monoraphidium neglectum]|uniref:Uncharacterized protein n=1 Tax=Monoraphidium neglectum TaxID=145388 RepID=A0A0D2NR12_9CHLO|nr:hypothetical protein MNEG_1176 [Monoraphidium neglectum]KIZ06766.1 hypothetical protein MNEG_1176 [Monoraphidium neglectum]|eukprot:XP_013905785.1 hypothetical protein MNEG_1176 [Monoraphidium neglectum]